MKSRIALLVVLAIVVFVWFQRGAPNPLAARYLGATAADIETAYKTEHAWAIREIAADISEMAGKGRSRSDAPGVVETMVPWHPDLMVPFAASQIGQAGDAKPDENDRRSARDAAADVRGCHSEIQHRRIRGVGAT